MAALGQGAILVGIPVAVTTTYRAQREAKDRGFVWAAIAICMVQALGGVVAILGSIFGWFDGPTP